MAITIDPLTVTTSATTGSIAGMWRGNNDGETLVQKRGTWDGVNSSWQNVGATGFSGYTGVTSPTYSADTQHYGYMTLYFSVSGNILSGTYYFKIWPALATASTPTASSITSSTATIACNYFPNVSASTCSAQLQYKTLVETLWTNAGTANTTGGSSQVSESEAITGLTANTVYQVRLVITRTTSNYTSLTSAVFNFTTLPGVPGVTTNATTSLASTSATLQSTVAINQGTTVTTYWKWGTDNPPTGNTTASQNVSADGPFSVGITGLSQNTTYYAQAFVAYATPPGTPSSGAVVSFITPADPAAEAASEDHLTIQEYDAVYGTQKAFVFLAASPSATSSNIFLSAAAPWATTECRITIDGGTVADCTNAPTRIGTSAFYTITLTAAELAGENIWVHISDSAVAARDVALHIRTSLELGKVVLNAAGTTPMTNTSAMSLTGVGSGSGLIATGGATGNDIAGALSSHSIRRSTATAGAGSTITLDSSASATNDYYNGSIIITTGGTGPNQSRLIIDYVGASKVATVHRTWATNPASGTTFVIIPAEDVWTQAAVAELSAVPTLTSSWADKLAFMWQRFTYKRTETATTFEMFKADSSTSLGTATVGDSAGTQTHGKIS